MSKLYKKISVIDLEELILSIKNLPVELDKNQFKIKKVRKTVEDWFEQLEGDNPLPRKVISSLSASSESTMPPDWKDSAAGIILNNLLGTFKYVPQEQDISNLKFEQIGADSMDLIEVGLYIEDKLGVELSNSQSEELSRLSLGQLYNTLAEFLKK